MLLTTPRASPSAGHTTGNSGWSGPDPAASSRSRPSNGGEVRYLSAGVTFAPRTWRTSPPFERLDRELAAGASPDHPLFPVVWPADG